jgi:hypothetical protein
MKLFVAGIMQGSLPGVEVHSQDYRVRVKQMVNAHYPEIEVICPWELHPNSPDYGPDKAKETLLAMAELAGQCEIVVAFLPQASMGTALEMCRAYDGQCTILTISPLRSNWVVQSLSDRIFPTLEEFEAYVVGGRLMDGVTPRSGA